MTINFHATLNAFFAMHHQNEHMGQKSLFFGISPIETNTDAIQVQVAGFAKNEQICFYHIRSIRHRGYYLFHRPILCGIYSRVAFIDISEHEPHPHATPTFSVYTVGVACGRG